MPDHPRRIQPEFQPGERHTTDYPFVRVAFRDFDVSSGAGVFLPSWRPGIDTIETDRRCRDFCIAHGRGLLTLTVVSIHKPGRFPTRIFFTRRWTDPDGREFGKPACRVATVDKFRRTLRGYHHDWVVRDVPVESIIAAAGVGHVRTDGLPLIERQVEALQWALDRLAETPGWRPIEEAPRDAGVVL